MSIRQAGRLDTRVTIQRKQTSQSNSGATIETWQDLATRWADVRPLTGAERLQGESVTAKDQVQIKLRWDASIADLSPLDRIIIPSSASSSPTDVDTYNIIQASVVDRNEDFLIIAYRFANAG